MGFSITRFFRLVEKFHVLLDPVFKFEGFPFVDAVVLQQNFHPGVQKGQLAQSLGQNLVLEIPRGQENLRIGKEGDLGARFPGRADHLHLLSGFPLGKLHVIYPPVPAHLHLEMLGNRVHTFGAHPVQSTRYLIGAFTEFSTGMKVHQNQLQGGNLVFGMDIDRNAAAIIGNGAGSIQVYGDRNEGTVTGQRLIDGIVHDLEYAVVQAPFIGIPDIHVRPFANPFQTLEFLDFGGVVAGRVR